MVSIINNRISTELCEEGKGLTISTYASVGLPPTVYPKTASFAKTDPSDPAMFPTPHYCVIF